MMSARIGWLVVAVLFVLPWTTWMAIATPNVHQAVTLMPLWVFVLGGMLVVSGMVMALDAWLGLFVGWWVIRAAPHTFETGIETALIVLLGAVALLAVREIPASQHERLKTWLVVAGLMQAIYVYVQWLGVDPIWTWVSRHNGWPAVPIEIKGTLGNYTYAACFLAMIVPVAPLWLSPVLLGAILLTHSAMGLVAAVVGMLVTQRVAPKVWLVGTVGMGMALLVYPHVEQSWLTRWYIWHSLLTDQTWLSALIGHGPSAFGHTPRIVWTEIFFQAHNEYLQVVYEVGLIGVALIAGWVLAHQRTLARSAFAGSVVAAAIASCTMFPFHLAIPGLTALVTMGAATHEGDEL